MGQSVFDVALIIFTFNQRVRNLEDKAFAKLVNYCEKCELILFSLAAFSFFINNVEESEVYYYSIIVSTKDPY